jgi:hypothetical protein
MAARFVRLAGSGEEAEHLRAPVVLLGPGGGARLGYAAAPSNEEEARNNEEEEARGQTLVSAPPGRSLLRPLLEGALGVVLVTLLLGALAEMTSGTYSPLGSKTPGNMLTALLVLVGFQGVRSSVPFLIRAYALGEVCDLM